MKKKVIYCLLSLLMIVLYGCSQESKSSQKNVKKEPPVSLTDKDKKETAMELVSSAENSSLNWKKLYSYIEDIKDGRGYTAGIIGFCSGTGDMLEVVKNYTQEQPDNKLAKFLPALKKVNGSDSHEGLGVEYEQAWKEASKDPVFQKAQNKIRNRDYFKPAVKRAKKDGLSVLGQFIYYDAIVMHGPGDGSVPADQSFFGIRKTAMAAYKTPSQGGNEKKYLTVFLDKRDKVMHMEDAHDDLSRTQAQRKFLKEKNYDLNKPLKFKMYGDLFKIK